VKNNFLEKMYLWSGMTPSGSYRSELSSAVCRERLASAIRPESLGIYPSSEPLYPMGRVGENEIWFTFGNNNQRYGGATRMTRCLIKLRSEPAGTLVFYSFIYSPAGKFLLISIGITCLLLLVYFILQHMWFYAFFIVPSILCFPMAMGFQVRKPLVDFLRKTLPPSRGC